MDYMNETPRTDESAKAYALRVEKEGAREIVIRKGLRAHFDMSMEEAIQVCSILSDARHRELLELRTRFPDLNENRFAWRISKSLTIPKEAALVWAQTIQKAETGA
jgi:hypothetical protein